VKHGWDPEDWNVQKDLPLDKLNSIEKKKVALSDEEIGWIEAWNDFVLLYKNKFPKSNLPGFPIWADAWQQNSDLKIPQGTPDWKKNFLKKNSGISQFHAKRLTSG
jgi:DNA (cytosine-5)-methyltransferase 1